MPTVNQQVQAIIAKAIQVARKIYAWRFVSVGRQAIRIAKRMPDDA